jgi:hypothetical protein
MQGGNGENPASDPPAPLVDRIHRYSLSIAPSSRSCFSRCCGFTTIRHSVACGDDALDMVRLFAEAVAQSTSMRPRAG